METTRVNWDNGDIIDFIMDLAEPPFPECKPKRIVDYRNQYVPCLRCGHGRGSVAMARCTLLLHA